MRILTAVKDSHDTCLSVLGVLLPSHVFSLSFLARGEAAGSVGKEMAVTCSGANRGRGYGVRSGDKLPV